MFTSVAISGRSLWASRGALKAASNPSFATGMRGLAIPVTHVARIARTHVKNEEEAEKLDAYLRDVYIPTIKAQKGFVKTERTVCKAEWAYEVASVFEAEHFKDFMESDARTELTTSLEAVLKELNLSMSDLYLGNRVFDEYK
eukprot:CAMPEP_0197462592 /NCGR_PEP_ID=MMETSP1175-20131217/59509_1 /TAXON_ID=1003142 /ORGANISM="Triceratium dubium, Strain CCMP147" /LENGTH=142 /DNA_ID=CAMNT_0042998133 /DNA_START=11 /DNA_END=439 /DNA_ORIENTATION=+